MLHVTFQDKISSHLHFNTLKTYFFDFIFSENPCFSVYLFSQDNQMTQIKKSTNYDINKR